MTRRNPGPTDPFALAGELTAIRDQLVELRQRSDRLGREYVWLDTDTLTAADDGHPMDTAHALHAARNSFDDFSGSLGLATDAASLANTHLNRLALRDQQ